jgi:hypothetical protein
MVLAGPLKGLNVTNHERTNESPPDGPSAFTALELVLELEDGVAAAAV